MNFKEHLDTQEVFARIAHSARHLGVEAYVVGGYVRDLILERPSHDIDVVCLGAGIDLAEHFHQSIGSENDFAVFKNFGTAMVRYDNWEVEFVGARKESYQVDSRKPSVENGSLEDDQNRRDFTINALAISLQKENYGEVIDPFGGLNHIRERTLKTPLDPDITFSDDPLRMMRACRFAAQLNFDIDADTFEALSRNKERIKIVSGERIIEEINKIILTKKPSYGFKLLHIAGILELIFPELVALQGAETIEGKGHKDNFFHTLQVLDNIAENTQDLWLRWAAIMHDIAKPATKRFDAKVGWTFHGHEEKGARMTPGIFRKLKLPLNEKMKYVQKLVRLHLRPIALIKEEVTDSALRRLLFEAGEDIEDLMTLCRADITSKNDNKVKKYLHNFDQVQAKLIEVEEKDKLRNFQPVMDGAEIMQYFDIQPGKQVGELKTALREAILEGELPNEKEAALDFLKQYAIKIGVQMKV